VEPNMKAAIEWEILFRSGEATEGDRLSFNEWCAAHPGHQESWAALQARMQPLQTLRTNHPAAGRQALLAPSPSRRRLLSAGAVSGLTLLLGAVGLRVATHALSLDADWRSGVGSREVIDLGSGSRLTLDANTSLYGTDTGADTVRLTQGQIFADLSEAQRPLTVQTRYGVVSAATGSLNLNLYTQHAVLAVDGTPAQLSLLDGSRTVVASGQVVAFSDQGVAKLSDIPTSVFAWTSGLLVVSDATLADVVESLGRYHFGILHADQTVAGRRVGGVFRLDNPLGSIHQLASSLALTVTTYSDYIVVLSA